MRVRLAQADVLEHLRGCKENTFDGLFCDPPYGLKFMGKHWDYDVPSVEVWEECLRVLKPGAALLAFGGSRTFHRMAVNIEDAGFEIRDTLTWLYGSGFPKSLDVSKAIDKAAGAERTSVIGSYRTGEGAAFKHAGNGREQLHEAVAKEILITAPSTDLAKQWHGYGTALKPAWEPIILARKPMDGTVANNVAKWGTGGLAIDASRIGNSKDVPASGSKHGSSGYGSITRSADTFGTTSGTDPNVGRWPANVILDEQAGMLLDAQSGVLKSGDIKPYKYNGGNSPAAMFSGMSHITSSHKGDSGGASRFFYTAKASRKERGEDNLHPTVKPLSLTTYLARLILPPTDAHLLIPFAGSGSEVIGALRAGWTQITAIEREAEYVAIAKARIQKDQPLFTQVA